MLSCVQRPRASPGDVAVADTDIELVNVRFSRAEIADVIGQAFAGTERCEPEWSMHYVLGPQLRDYNDVRRRELATFWMTVPTVQHGHPRRGWVLGVRNPTDGILEAVVIVRRFEGDPGADIWATATSIATLMSGAMLPFYDGKLPQVYSDSGMRTRIGDAQTTRAFDGLFAKMEEMHKIWADKPHYYVAIMAVEPTSQGTGKCSKLMRAVNRMADAEGVDCYLECSGKRNRAIYKRFGYEEKGVYTVTVEKEEEGSEPYKELFAMVRPPGGSGGASAGGEQATKEKKGPFGLW